MKIKKVAIFFTTTAVAFLSASLASPFDTYEVAAVDVDEATARPHNRHMVMASDRTIALLYYDSLAQDYILGKRSIDLGATWTGLDGGPDATVIKSGTWPYPDFSICKSVGDDIYVVYAEYTGIYFRKLTYSPSTRTWEAGPQILIAEVPPGGLTLYSSPSIVVAEDGKIWVCYCENSGSGPFVVVLRAICSSDEFATLGTIYTIASEAGWISNHRPALVPWNGQPFVVYKDPHYHLQSSHWTGSAWTSAGAIPTPEGDSVAGTFGDYFSVVSLGNIVHVVASLNSNRVGHWYYDGAWQGPQYVYESSSPAQVNLLASMDTELWAFISTVPDKRIAFKKWSGGSWESKWTDVTTSGVNYYPTTPSASQSIIPVAWTDASETKVKFSIVEVKGVPVTRIRFEGAVVEMQEGIYIRPGTRVVIESVGETVATTILYRDNKSEWKTYTKPFTLSPGKHIIEYYGIDKFGHEEKINQSKIIYVSSAGTGDVTNRPNPFRAGEETTLIEYQLKEPSNVTVTIYDLLGNEVWHKSYAAGENGGRKDNSVTWDGRNLSGKVVANGGYICRVWIEKEKRHIIGKIAVAK